MASSFPKKPVSITFDKLPVVGSSSSFGIRITVIHHLDGYTNDKTAQIGILATLFPILAKFQYDTNTDGDEDVYLLNPTDQFQNNKVGMMQYLLYTQSYIDVFGDIATFKVN